MKFLEELLNECLDYLIGIYGRFVRGIIEGLLESADINPSVTLKWFIFQSILDTNLHYNNMSTFTEHCDNLLPMFFCLICPFFRNTPIKQKKIKKTLFFQHCKVKIQRKIMYFGVMKISSEECTEKCLIFHKILTFRTKFQLKIYKKNT